MQPKYSDNDPKGWCGDPTRGAALGRPTDKGDPAYAGAIYVKNVPLIGDYDVNGTYFGGPGPLFWYASEDGTIDAMHRAKSLSDAMAFVRREYPHADVRRAPLERARTKKDLIASLDEFTEAYITCALWSSVESYDNDAEGYDRPLDEKHDVWDVSCKTLRAMIKDCAAFQAANAVSSSQAGHDFWLSRNGHGTGFWDRGLGAEGDRLTDAAHAFGEVNLYVWRGRIYQ